MNSTPHILVIETPQADQLLTPALRRMPHALAWHATSKLEEAQGLLAQNSFDVVAVDLRAENLLPLQIIRMLQQQAPYSALVVLVPIERREEGRQAVQEWGAADYLDNEMTADEMLYRLQRTIEAHRWQQERQHLSAQRAEIQRRFDLVIHSNADGILVVRRDGKIVFANDTALTLFGSSRAALLATPFGHPILSSESTDLDILRPDGRRCIAEMRVVPIDWEAEPVFLASLRDVTQQRKIERALLEQERQYRTILKTMRSGVALTSLEGAIQSFNPSLLQMLGVTHEQLLDYSSLSDGWQTFVHKDQDDGILGIAPLFGPLAPAGTQMVRVERPDGTTIWLQRSMVEIYDEERQQTESILFSFHDVTDQQEREEALRTSQYLYRTLTRHFPQGAIFLFDKNLTIQIADGQLLAKWGLQEAELVGGSLIAILPPAIITPLLPHFRGALIGISTQDEVTVDDFQYLVQIVPLPLKGSRGPQGLAIIQDVTDRKHVEDQLQQTNSTLQLWISTLEQRNLEEQLMREMGDLFQSTTSTDEMYPIVGHFAAKLFPGSSGTLYLCDPEVNLAESVVTWGQHNATVPLMDMDACWALRRGRSYIVQQDSDLLCPHLKALHHSHSLCIPLNAQGSSLGVLQIQHNPTNTEHWQRQAESFSGRIALALANIRLYERLRYQSIRDPLTGLYNRRYMEESFQQALRRAMRQDHPIGVIMMDVDNFKHFNDVHGHQMGDALLTRLGELLLHNARREDIPCRYGGEELTIILPGASIEDTARRANELLQAVREMTLPSDSIALRITVSMGVAAYPEHGLSTEAVLHAADKALYRSKAAGRDCVTIAPRQQKEEQNKLASGSPP